MMKKIPTILFYLLLALFSLSYWSFFPGGYTYDTYISYLNALGLFQYLEVVPPIYAISWKLLNNYNFAPFVINYLIFIIALFLSIRFTKSYQIAIFSLLGICLPYTLITYICNWKDTALLSILFLVTVLCLNKNKSLFNQSVILILFFISFAVRLNALFAVIPLLYYFLQNRERLLKSVVLNTKNKAYNIQFNDKYRRLKTIGLTFIIILTFQVVNKTLNTFIFNAVVGNVEQTIMFTDIAKINYLQQRNVTDDIPEAFITTSSLDPENVDKIFGVYFDYSCNDWLYMYPETKGAKAFLHMGNDEEALRQLKINWIKKIIYNPISYLRIRITQLKNALSKPNLLYSPPMLDFNEEMFNRIAGGSEVTKNFDRGNKVFTPFTNSVSVNVRDYYNYKSSILDFLSSGALFFILSIIMFVIFLLNQRKNSFFRFGKFLSLSGILYIVGYLPWLPCTDHRYFIWTVFAFWVSVGILVLASIKNSSTDSNKIIPSNN